MTEFAHPASQHQFREVKIMHPSHLATDANVPNPASLSGFRSLQASLCSNGAFPFTQLLSAVDVHPRHSTVWIQHSFQYQNSWRIQRVKLMKETNSEVRRLIRANPFSLTECFTFRSWSRPSLLSCLLLCLSVTLSLSSSEERAKEKRSRKTRKREPFSLLKVSYFWHFGWPLKTPIFPQTHELDQSHPHCTVIRKYYTINGRASSPYRIESLQTTVEVIFFSLRIQ